MKIVKNIFKYILLILRKHMIISELSIKSMYRNENYYAYFHNREIQNKM